MAGSLLDDLTEAFDDDEVLGAGLVQGGVGDEGEEKVPLVDAEDFMRRAVHMIDPGRVAPPLESESADPEEKADYYRRMVQMQEMMRSNGYEGMGIVEAVLSGDIAEQTKAIGLQVCSEFQSAGKCRSGVNCKYVHDGAFRASANGYVQDANGVAGDEITVDPEDFIRRALQLRSLQQKNNKSAPGRSTLAQEHHRIPYW